MDKSCLFSGKDFKSWLHFLQGKTGILACKRYGSTALSYEQVRDDSVVKISIFYEFSGQIRHIYSLVASYITSTRIYKSFNFYTSYRTISFGTHLVHVYTISLQ